VKFNTRGQHPLSIGHENQLQESNRCSGKDWDSCGICNLEILRRVKTMVRVIKSEKEYESALAEINALMDRDPDPGTPEADRLELLTLLEETFESQNFPKRIPRPLEAIRFRMEQEGLKTA
jgi:hypothetical protein